MAPPGSGYAARRKYTTNLELDNEVIELRRHGTNDVVKRFQLDPKARTCIETPPELRRRGATGPFP